LTQKLEAPQLGKHLLITKKAPYFILFKQIITLMNNKEHLTLEGLHKIMAIRGSLNLGYSYELITNFPNIQPIEIPLIIDHKIIYPN